VKIQRHAAILRVVRERRIESQDELREALAAEGFVVTQATLSRDIRELGLAKTPAGYVIPGDLATVTPIVSLKRVDQLLRDSVIFAEAAGNLVVLKTPAAAAQPVARALDATPPEDALGTVGGDDTIFVAFRHAASANTFVQHAQQIAGITPRRVRA
jgi:transcriptional regulator of arginine metabolism